MLIDNKLINKNNIIIKMISIEYIMYPFISNIMTQIINYKTGYIIIDTMLIFSLIFIFLFVDTHKLKTLTSRYIKNIKETQSSDITTNNSNQNDINDIRVLYRNSDVLLQKWNNIILNYNGGTLDVFYNGELVKSAIEVVPYLKYDMLTVGSNDGISGSVANLVYFREPINVVTVNNIYNTC